MKQAWKDIQVMGWATVSEDYEAIARKWYAELGTAGMKQLEKFVGNRVAELYAAVEKYEKTHKALDIGSDDGMSDVLHHVVGLGEAEFNACLKDPTLIEKRYINAEYKESFAYCFQQPEPLLTKESFAYCFQQPEPLLTKAQKEETEQALLQAVTELNKKIRAIDSQLTELQGIMSQTMRLVERIKEAKKSS
jgi:hypothetical protein